MSVVAHKVVCGIFAFAAAWLPSAHAETCSAEVEKTASAGAVQAGILTGKYTGEEAATYDGYLLNANGAVVGTINVKAAKARIDRKTGAKTSAVTVTVCELGQKKRTLKGSLDLTTGELSYKTESALAIVIGNDGISGSYSFGHDCMIFGTRNFFTTKSEEKSDVLAKFNGCTYTVALRTEDDDGAAVAGYSTLSVSIGAKGKVKTTGVLADGTKVSVASQLLVDANGVCCVPVLAQLYTGKVGGFGFLMRLDAANPLSVKVEALSGWDGTGSKPVGFTAAWSARDAGAPGSLGSGSVFNLEDVWASVNGAKPLRELLPVNEPVATSGEKWTVAKAGRVNLEKSGSLTYDAKANPSGLKLTYAAKTGLFKGRFSVYTLVGGRLKKVSVTVNGAVVDGVGYGTAAIKKIGNVPVVINHSPVAPGDDPTPGPGPGTESEAPPSQDARLASALAYGYIDDSSEEAGNPKWPIKRGLWAVTKDANGSCVLEIDSSFGRATFRGAELNDLCTGSSRRDREIVLTGSGGETLTLRRRFDLAWYFTDYEGEVTGGIFGDRELDVNGACDRFDSQQDAAVKAGVKAYVDVVAGTYRLQVSERSESERQTQYGYYPYEYSIGDAGDSSSDLRLTVARDGTASVSGTMGGAAVSGTTRLLFWTASDYANAIFWIHLADGREAVLFISFYSTDSTRVMGDGMLLQALQDEPGSEAETEPEAPPSQDARLASALAYGYIDDSSEETGNPKWPIERGLWAVTKEANGSCVLEIDSSFGRATFRGAELDDLCTGTSWQTREIVLTGSGGETLTLRRRFDLAWYFTDYEGKVAGGIFGDRELDVDGACDRFDSQQDAAVKAGVKAYVDVVAGTYRLQVAERSWSPDGYPYQYYVSDAGDSSSDLRLTVARDGTASVSGTMGGAAVSGTTRLLFWTASDYANAIFWIPLADGREAVLFISFYSSGQTRVLGDGSIQDIPQSEPFMPVEPWPITPCDPSVVTNRAATVSTCGFLADVMGEGTARFRAPRNRISPF